MRIHPALGGEEFLALDDKTYTLGAGQMVISDDQGVESLAGIMGGAASGCSDDTVDVFIESAYWDPITIAATGRALKINSDARYRFETRCGPGFHAGRVGTGHAHGDGPVRRRAVRGRR